MADARAVEQQPVVAVDAALIANDQRHQHRCEAGIRGQRCADVVTQRGTFRLDAPRKPFVHGLLRTVADAAHISRRTIAPPKKPVRVVETVGIGEPAWTPQAHRERVALTRTQFWRRFAPVQQYAGRRAFTVRRSLDREGEAGTGREFGRQAGHHAGHLDIARLQLRGQPVAQA
ncbi:hypothetical protein AWV80_10095 [Cupriavidus sp. UYMU48A]|nr:hypothetical protein AWV80_10095 [Cupriavidus sp. UYMU48A]